MAKKKQSTEREVTRKEHAYRRRDAERNRRVMLGLAAVAVLIVGLIGAGVIQELVIKPNQPIAVVDGNAIGAQDWVKRVKFEWNQQGSQLQDPEGTSSQVLDEMIDEQLIREQAAAKGITVSKDEVDEALEQTFGYLRNTPTPSPTPSVSPTPPPTPTPGGSPTPTPFPTPTPLSFEAYQQALKDFEATAQPASGMGDADLRKLVEVNLLRRKLYEQVSKDVPTTEEAIHARHILVAIRTPEPTATPWPTGVPTPTSTAQPTALPGGTPNPTVAPTPTPLPPRDDAQALAKIVEIQQKLGAGQDFAELAKQYSDDTGSAAQGGDLGWFGKGQMDPAFEKAAFELELGKTSDPVKSQFGYHLIQVLEKDPNHPIDEYQLYQNKLQFFNQWLAEIKQGAKITRNWSPARVPATPVPGKS